MINRDYSLDRLIEVRIRFETAGYALRQAARVSLDVPLLYGVTDQIDALARQIEELADRLIALEAQVLAAGGKPEV